MNQMPGGQTFIDHLGRAHGRRPNDIFAHRIMVFFKGWLGTPKLVYKIILWTVNPTDQKNSLRAWATSSRGVQPVCRPQRRCPGRGRCRARTLLARPRPRDGRRVLPAVLHARRVGEGEVIPGLWYNVMVGNNLSALGINATQLTGNGAPAPRCGGCRRRTSSAPTARSATGSTTRTSRRDSACPDLQPGGAVHRSVTGATDNTIIRLADSLNVFEPGALAPGVTVQDGHYRLLSFDAGLKYKGIFLQAENYQRWLDDFMADGSCRSTRSTIPGSTCRRRSTRSRRSWSCTARRRGCSATSPPGSARATNTSAA